MDRLNHSPGKRMIAEPHILPGGGAAKVGAGHTAAPPPDGMLERLQLSTPSPRSGDPTLWLTQENLRRFLALFEQNTLTAVFQPILDFNQQRFLGYEGLIRGPAGTPLHAPQVLLDLAHESGMTMQFERLCRETVLRGFARLRLPGRLFMNVSAGCLADPHFLNGETSSLLQSLQLRPGQIVIEITENQQVGDFSALREVLDHYRGLGYEFAIDDLGEGFSNLRMWSEIHPEFVKIDKHFIRGIADDPLKLRLVQAMRDIAENSRAALIAEGIETEAEFMTLRDLGIDCGQGFLIAHPPAAPPTAPDAAVGRMLRQSTLIVFPQTETCYRVAVRQLLQPVAPISPLALNEQVFARFEQEPEQIVLPVIDADGTPLGLINRYSLIDRFARPFRRELYGKKPCTQFMNPNPIRADHAMSVQELGQLFGRADHQQLVDGFIITENGRYLGIGSSQSLMGLITEMQMRAARYANPLTQLPGNVPINEHIDRLLANETEFVACYCDLDHFKPYNDAYGYRKGDQLIQHLAGILGRHCDARLDFVGHIGGDDFILLMQSPDWEARCRSIIAEFERGLDAFVATEDLRRGGYLGEDRRGRRIFHAVPGLSIGALLADPHLYHSHLEVSAAMSNAKKEAKKLAGSALFIERRRPAG